MNTEIMAVSYSQGVLLYHYNLSRQLYSYTRDSFGVCLVSLAIECSQYTCTYLSVTPCSLYVFVCVLYILYYIIYTCIDGMHRGSCVYWCCYPSSELLDTSFEVSIFRQWRKQICMSIHIIMILCIILQSKAWFCAWVAWHCHIIPAWVG